MEEEFVEVVEYWDKASKVYEVMLWPEFEKKRHGLPYEALRSSECPPWVEVSKEAKDADWLALRTPMRQKEFKNKFPNS